MKQKREGGTCSCLRAFDFYKDLPKGLAEPTFIGATFSTGFVILLATLLFYQVAEFNSY